MAVRTLFVHCGGSKAGSSAIQNFLELQRDALAAVGFAYLNPVRISSEHQIQSGNGAELAMLLVDPQAATSNLEALLRGLVHDESNAICSSEFFSDLDEAAWNRFNDVALRIGVELRPIFFVRNVIPFLGSLYDQAIKRHGEWRSFDVWCQEGVWQHPRALRALHGSDVSGAVKVLHYDRSVDCMVEQFLRAIGVGRDFPLREDDRQRRVNRSLRQGERDALRLINETIGGEYSEEVSDMLLRVLPHSPTEPEDASPLTLTMLRDRYQPDVDWINQTWFDGAPVVSVQASDHSAVGASSLGESAGTPVDAGTASPYPLIPGQASDSQDFDHMLLFWCIRKMQQALDKSIENLAAQLRRIDWENSLNPAIPQGFDPVAYLLLNPDLIKGRAKPFQHFLEYGRHEPGRLWEWRDL